MSIYYTVQLLSFQYTYQ